jgi:predicted nucleic acid-binding protein
LIIIDASVAVKWVVPEEGTRQALELTKEELEHLP